METYATCAEIALAIKMDIIKKQLKIVDVARILGISPQLASSHLSGKHYMQKKTALKFSEILDYNIDFLMFGKGSLYKTKLSSNKKGGMNETGNKVSFVDNDNEYVRVFREMIDVQWKIIEAQRILIDQLQGNS